MKCELSWCQKERVCLHYCTEHHRMICIDGNSSIDTNPPPITWNMGSKGIESCNRGDIILVETKNTDDIFRLSLHRLFIVGELKKDKNERIFVYQDGEMPVPIEYWHRWAFISMAEPEPKTTERFTSFPI